MLTLLPEAVWDSVLSVAPEDRFLFIIYFFVRKVASYDGAMLKVTELFSKAILLPMFVNGDCMAVCLILYICQQRVWLLGHGNPFHEAPTNSSCADVAFRGSLELPSKATEDRRFVCTSKVWICEVVWPTTLWLSRYCS